MQVVEARVEVVALAAEVVAEEAAHGNELWRKTKNNGAQVGEMSSKELAHLPRHQHFRRSLEERLFPKRQKQKHIKIVF